MTKPKNSRIRRAKIGGQFRDQRNNVFGLGVCWLGLRMNLSDTVIQTLRVRSSGTSLLRILSLPATSYAAMRSARCVSSCLSLSRRYRLTVAALVMRLVRQTRPLMHVWLRVVGRGSIPPAATGHVETHGLRVNDVPVRRLPRETTAIVG